jgi:hypothetical protein
MRLATLAGLYVAVVLSAQIGANKIIRLPLTHLAAPGGVYSIGVALALVQLAHHTGTTRRNGALNAHSSSSPFSPRRPSTSSALRCVAASTTGYESSPRPE